MKLLVVDDDPNVLNLLCATLRADSYDVVSAADGDEAIVLAREHVPDRVHRGRHGRGRLGRLEGAH